MQNVLKQKTIIFTQMAMTVNDLTPISSLFASVLSEGKSLLSD